MRAELQVSLAVGTDEDLTNVLWQETDATLNKIVRDDCDCQSSGVAQVAVSPGTYTVPMGDVLTGKILFLSSDKEITVKLSGATHAITIKPSGSYRGVLCLHGQFTGAVITGGAAKANVRYCVVGTEA